MSFSIDPQTIPGAVALTVHHLQESVEFYQEVLGLRKLPQEDDAILLCAGAQPILKLFADPSAVAPPPRATGLYHFAVLLPSRADLGAMLRHLSETRWPLQGFADHAVSEAIYLADPEGNGIELYCDRPRADWPFFSGKLQMTTDPLDIDSLLAEANPIPSGGKTYEIAQGTRMGHVHLRVSDRDAAEAFYTTTLGFDLVVRYGPSAGFVSAGGYHHHIGFNSWNSAGGPIPRPGSLGLRFITLVLPNEPALQLLADHLRTQEISMTELEEGIEVQDPAGNMILFTIPHMI